MRIKIQATTYSKETGQLVDRGVVLTEYDRAAIRAGIEQLVGSALDHPRDVPADRRPVINLRLEVVADA
jgi:hypothetical protein